MFKTNAPVICNHGPPDIGIAVEMCCVFTFLPWSLLPGLCVIYAKMAVQCKTDCGGKHCSRSVGILAGICPWAGGGMQMTGA